MVEVNRTGVFVGVFALLLWFRNAFFSEMVLSRYPQYPYRMLGNFVRCSNAYFSAKCQKPLHRMLIFNLIRCMIPEIVKELLFKGKLILPELQFVFTCCVTYTIVFHYTPLS